MDVNTPFEEYPGYSELTDREREVLGLLSEGKSSKEICFLIISCERTVDLHRKNIMDKLGIEDVKELVKPST
ncbi:MAG: helix-turn-helix transcriptional regulator [Proteobacteria bacterium]|nr:helix-turn-helix transcriptional regulator [Pseudomonadota bacterium]